jgi:hypothetical protein
MQLKNPAKHTPQSFIDQEAISMVSAWLAETKRAMPDLRANDKWPNIDGYIEIVDENGFPTGILKAQVKKLSKNDANKKQYTFKKNDRKFLSYCKESTDLVPILLIGVGLENGNKKAFWLHIDNNFLVQNGNNKIIKFIDTQAIESGRTDFIGEWERIIALYRSKSEEFERYKKEFSILSNIISILGKTDDKFIKIHYFLDELNDYLDHKFSIIKKLFYPKAWKLGFAYYAYSDRKLAYTLYPIPQNKNDIQIKEVGKDFPELIRSEGLFTAYFNENPIEKDPQGLARKEIKSRIEKILKGKVLDHSGNEFLAREYIFAFIDKFNVQMGLKQKEEYLISEIEEAFYRYLPLWLKFSYELLLSENRNNLKDRLKDGREQYFDPEIISEMTLEEERLVRERIKGSLNEKIPPFNFPIGNNEFSFRIFIEFFSFLKQKVTSIQRLYKQKDFSRITKNNNFAWSIFSKEDTIINLKIFFDGLLQTYDSFIDNNFPKLSRELSLFDDANIIAISCEMKEKSRPTYEVYYLASENMRDGQKIVLLDEKEKEDFKKYDLRMGEVNFRGNKYNLRKGMSSILDFIYDETPMLNYIYKALSRKLEKYFKSKD